MDSADPGLLPPPPPYLWIPQILQILHMLQILWILHARHPTYYYL